ncbi:MAG TPA: metallophosphoesterase family protein [Thermodesulfobacteriota bacterium]|nr:metallophosphoesterase family protein [Thermodesulfobacteriota bacterium]
MVTTIKQQRIGVISDTHGLVRPEALDAFRGVELILHAGDVGDREVIEKLQAVAPVRAVRGNVDVDEWSALPETDVVEIGGVLIYLLHDLHRLDLDPAASGFRAVVSGHSHKPSSFEKNGVLYLNPGSAGPRRFRLPVSVALVRIRGGVLEPQLVELGVGHPIRT